MLIMSPLHLVRAALLKATDSMMKLSRAAEPIRYTKQLCMEALSYQHSREHDKGKAIELILNGPAEHRESSADLVRMNSEITYRLEADGE